ncbi:5-oxoprolinase subunit PxpA [Methylobacterium sp.]|uniref:5-oxoprolinase subunit PxpA n=1 Tax=Methylobacterium sp. TaxID=409 RepID=UPI0025E043FE|nr:5-oxoprolinase subunit PxpA [Methylobacterium sp.]MBY0260062.1 LamB/YcsF family protein [Methylobacterium sp.]
MPTIDLNADLGEGFGAYRCGDDAAMLGIVTSANVACGFHAGDPEIMAETFALARSRGVAVGAHPGYADLPGFGRRPMPVTAAEIERQVAYQVGAAQGLAALAGHRLGYVKAHGALANRAAAERDAADAVARAVRAVDPTLGLLAIARTQQVAAGEAAGLAVYAEIFADRGYDEAGRLIPRGRAGALVTDPETAAERVLAMVRAGAIVTAAGTHLPTRIDSVCVHGDSAHAIAMARAVRARLEGAGIALRGFALRTP